MTIFAVVSVIVFFTGGTLFGAVFVGVGLAVFGWGMTRRGGRQITGTKCGSCAIIVTLEHEAEICTDCGAGLHARCLDAHRVTAHPAPAAPPAG